MSLDWIIFDLDDTLVASSQAYAHALRTVGIDPHSEGYARARRDCKAQLGAFHPASHQRLLYFLRMQRQGTLPAPSAGPAALLQLTRRYERALCARLKTSFAQQHTGRVLRALRRRYRLAVLTNETARSQWQKWAAIDPRGTLFDAFVTSEEVGAEKPDHKAFAAVLSLCQTSARHACFVGDDARTDLRPAAALGMRTVWTHQHLAAEKAAAQAALLPPGCATVAALAALPAVLAGWGVAR